MAYCYRRIKPARRGPQHVANRRGVSMQFSLPDDRVADGHGDGGQGVMELEAGGFYRFGSGVAPLGRPVRREFAGRAPYRSYAAAAGRHAAVDRAAVRAADTPPVRAAEPDRAAHDRACGLCGGGTGAVSGVSVEDTAGKRPELRSKLSGVDLDAAARQWAEPLKLAELKS